MERIFVVIPSFQEEDLKDTVNSIFENALEPNRVFVGICNQRVDSHDFDTFDCYENHVRLANVRSPQPLGLGFAYYTASKLIQDEEFILRIDAHTRMKNNWDATLVDYFNKIQTQEQSHKIIISQLTGGFYKVDLNKPDHTRMGAQNIWYHEKEPPNTNDWMNEQLRQLKLYAFNMDHDKSEKYGWTDYDLVNGYKEVHAISGSFHFAKSTFLLDCEPDPRIFFWGEEHIFAMRAWTRGYRIYSIDVNTQFTGGKPEEYLNTLGFLDWRSHLHNMNFTERSDFVGKLGRSDNVVKQILSGQEVGYYGAIDRKSYSAYMSILSINDHI